MTQDERFSVVTVNFKDWAVCEAGKVVATCSGRHAKEEAVRVGNGLRALEQVEVLQTQILMMADVIHKNDLWAFFTNLFVNKLPRGNDNG